MPITGKLEKRLRAGATLVTLIIVLPGMLLYYLLNYRLKSTLQYAVNKSSGGRYIFDSKSVSFSLLHKTFIIKDARLSCVDTNHTDAYYTLQVKEIFVSVASISAVLFNKKVLIDSLFISSPSVFIHVHQKIITEKKQGTFQTSNILDFLESTLKKINARRVEVKDASFTYKLLNGPPPFHAAHINFGLYNFAEVQKSDAHILGSDNVTLSMGSQNWVMPDGHHKITFRGLSFDGKSQHFVLDSCTIYRRASEQEGEMSIYAEKFAFNATHLPGIYMRNELVIDSLFCLSPVINLPKKSKQPVKDSGSTDAINYIFDKISVGYVAVTNGDIVVIDRKNQTEKVATHRTNLKIYHLSLDPTRSQPLSTDSVTLDLHDMTFVSSDSLFQLAIRKFSYNQNDVVFSDVIFGPVPGKKISSSIHFSAPTLLIKDVSLDDLLRRQIKASEALLIKPVITLVNNFAHSKVSVKNTQPAGKKLNMVYGSLHELRELINVNSFVLKDGKANLEMTGKRPAALSVEKIDFRLFLNKLFQSDSLVDIKHAIPDLKFGHIVLKSGGVKMDVTNYHFDGTRKVSWGDNLVVLLANGNVIEGKKIYWEVFDWDIFQKTKDIQVDLLRIGDLKIALQAKDKKINDGSGAAKRLPVMRIAKLLVNNVAFRTSGNTTINFDAGNVNVDNLQSSDQFLTWEKAFASVYNLSFQSAKIKASASNFLFNNDGTSLLHSISVRYANENDTLNFSVPVAGISSSLHSTDLKKISISSLKLNQPVIVVKSNTITSHPTANLQRAISLPHLQLDSIQLNDATVSYRLLQKRDSLILHTTADLDIHRLVTGINKNSMLALSALSLKLRNSSVVKKNIRASIPDARFTVKNMNAAEAAGNAIHFFGQAGFSWNHAVVKYHNDSTAAAITALNGIFRDDFFSYTTRILPDWRELIGKVSVNGVNLIFENKNLQAYAEKLSLHPPLQQLVLEKFSVAPSKSKEETFKTAQWQNDYITVNGKMLAVSGIHFGHTKKDSLIKISGITLNGINVEASRDKRMAFRHGIEKLMPTRLISRINVPFKVDSIVLQHDNVTYNERSARNGNWSRIPLQEINGFLFNFTNRYTKTDSLRLVVSASLLNNRIESFFYTESYNDSLSSFHAQTRFSPFELTQFSTVSMPMAGVSVASGTSENSYTDWTGNKYAAFGSMNFVYNNLKIKIHNKTDTSKIGFIASLKTAIANLILPSQHNQPSSIFVNRDREKFVFNYWVKAQTAGLLTTIGFKSNKKYRKEYMAHQKAYSLPFKSKAALKNVTKKKNHPLK